MSTSTLEAQQKPEKAFPEDRKKICTPQEEIYQKRFKLVTESELKELMEKRQSKAPKRVQNEVSNSFKFWKF